jgi:hypothetical protein
MMALTHALQRALPYGNTYFPDTDYVSAPNVRSIFQSQMWIRLAKNP